MTSMARHQRLTSTTRRDHTQVMQLGGIDTNLVIALRALLTERNVTRAAKSVGLGQSSMSHTLGRLRAHFGDALLVQVGRELVLTERAKMLVEPAEQAIAKLENVFLHKTKFDPATSQRVFRIASTDNLGFYLLPRLTQILAKEAPNIELRVQQLSYDWMQPLQLGEFDLKLGRKYRVPQGLHCQDLFEERFICVVAKGHPLAKKRLTARHYAELRHLAIVPTLTNVDKPGGYVDEILAREGLRRRVVVTISHFLVAPFIVASSDLALTGPERLLAPFIDSLNLRTLKLPMKLETYKLNQVWAARSDDDEAHRWLRDVIARAAKA
jgi:DNA-binding transcriptional LysR family regulator